MSQRVEFPDVNDRTVNEPAILVSPKLIVALWNQSNPKSERSRVDDQLEEWFCAQAKFLGWTLANFIGKQCLLQVTVRLG